MFSSSYDAIAHMYDRYWNDWYLPAALPALEELFFSRVRHGAKVLDVCCGSGHVTRELVRRGYCVTGVDISANLIEIARTNIPDAVFEVQDVTSMAFDAKFEAALSTFDAFNHLMTIQDIRSALSAVRRALLPGSPFVWDMNLEDAYQINLERWTATVEDASVGLVRGDYDSASRTATTELVWFERSSDNLWRRHDSRVRERCYELGEILDAAEAAGFTNVTYRAATAAGMAPDLALGRCFFTAIV